MQQISISTEGLAFSGIFADFKTRSINKFKLTGQCQSDIVKIFYRFDEHQQWREINSSDIDCANSNTFSFDFESDLKTIHEASGYQYDKAKKGKYPVLEFEFYGRTREYATNKVKIGVTSIIEPGHQGFSPHPEQVLVSESAKIKIRGKLSPFGALSTSNLQSASFKIRQGQLRTHNQ